MRYAIVSADGTVSNIAAADTIEDVFAPAGSIVLPANDDAEVGGMHDGVSFTRMPAIPEPAATTISKLQFVRSLRLAGEWGAVKAALKQSTTEVKEDWEHAYQLDRDDPMIANFADSLGIDAAAMDAIFEVGDNL